MSASTFFCAWWPLCLCSDCRTCAVELWEEQLENLITTYILRLPVQHKVLFHNHLPLFQVALHFHGLARVDWTVCSWSDNGIRVELLDFSLQPRHRLWTDGWQMCRLDVLLVAVLIERVLAGRLSCAAQRATQP